MEVFFAAVLENLTEGVVACDENGNLTPFNRSTREFHPIGDAPVPPEKWAEHYGLYYEDGITLLKMQDVPLYRALQGEVIKNVEVVIKNADQLRTVVCNGQSLYSPEGRKLGAVIAMHDVSEVKRAHAQIESERRFRTLFEQTPLSAQLLSADGHTLQVNTAWRKLWGIPEEAIRNYILKDYILLEDQQLVEKGIMPIIQQAFHGKVGKIPAICYDPIDLGTEGRKRWVEGFISPIFDAHGKVREVVLIHQDVTDKVESEIELKKAKESAEEANRLKSAFLANMSHEIRTPLGAILGFTELLKTSEMTSTEAQDYLETIDRSGKALVRLIDDILDLSKVEAGQLRIESSTVDLQNLLSEVDSLLKVQAQKQNTTVQMEEVPREIRFTQTDPIRLRQILINLIGNAIKFSPNAKVKISLEQTLKDNSQMLKFSIQDTGVGIPQNQQAVLFQPFRQIEDARNRKFGGTGLGLALSKRLAHALNGDVYLEKSQSGQGSLFILLLPLQSHFQDQEVADNMEPTPKDNFKNLELAGLKILVADDAEDNLKLIQVLLSKKGAKLETARNGGEAVQKALTQNFDLILMDIQMPIMDGFEAIQILRKKNYKGSIIALTAHAMIEEKTRCLEAGADAHHSKPLQVQALTSEILRLTGRKLA